MQVGADGEQPLLPLGRLGARAGGLLLEVPALPALHDPQPAGLVRARPAPVLPGGAAGHRHDVDPPGRVVDAAHRQRAHAHAVVLGELAGDVGGQREQGPLRAGELVLLHPHGPVRIGRRARSLLVVVLVMAGLRSSRGREWVDCRAASVGERGLMAASRRRMRSSRRTAPTASANTAATARTANTQSTKRAPAGPRLEITPSPQTTTIPAVMAVSSGLPLRALPANSGRSWRLMPHPRWAAAPASAGAGPGPGRAGRGRR